MPRALRPAKPARRFHRRETEAASPERREAWRWLASSRWLRLRAWYLARHPLCERCKLAGRIRPATEIHHKIPRREAPHLALRSSNLEALCKPCHSRETAEELRLERQGPARPEPIGHAEDHKAQQHNEFSETREGGPDSGGPAMTYRTRQAPEFFHGFSAPAPSWDRC